MSPRWWLALATLLGGLVASNGAVADRPINALAPFELFADGFQDLRGVAIDSTGNVFVADRVDGTVTRIAPDRTQTVIASGLQRPIGLAFEPGGLLLIAEEKAGRVVRVEANGSRTPVILDIKQPRWLAVRDDGTVFVSARRLTRDTDPEPDDESAEPEMILTLTPAGKFRVFADSFRNLQGLALNHTVLFAATQGRKGDRGVDGVIFQIPINADGSAGTPVAFGPTDQFKKPIGLARDRLAALYLTAQEFKLEKGQAKSAVAKLHADGHISLFASSLKQPEGLAFDDSGNLYVADGVAGRVLRFLASPAPTLSLPAFTNQSPLTVTGTTEPNAEVELFLNDATTPTTVTSGGTGAFTAELALTLNQSNTLEVFATAHAGDGLTGPPADATIVHDNVPPSLNFQAPPAGTYVRNGVSVQAQATDTGSGVNTLALTVDGLPLGAGVAPPLPAPSATATATWVTTSVPDGAHTLGATATDRAGNTATITRGVIVDNTPPHTQITSGPSGIITVATATFTFTGTDNLTPQASLVFAWRLDGGAFTPFTSATTATFTNLAAGSHTFEAKARDLAGNEDPTPASRTFTVVFGPTIAGVNPPSGPVGTLVTITGMNFAPGATQVAFNGVTAILHTITATTITTTVPPGATTGPLTVTTSLGTDSRPFTITTTGDFTLTGLPTPPSTVSVVAGDQGSASVQVGGAGAFTGLVSLSLSPTPAGIAAVLGSQFVAPAGSVFVTFNVATTVPPGNYAITVTGQAQVDAQVLTRSASLILQVLPASTSAVTGRVLTADAVPQPIPGATITLGSAFTLTDASGNFVLLSPPTGANMLLVDGRTASTPTAQYPPVEVNITVNASGPTRLPFIVYLPKLHTSNPITLPTDATGTVTQTVQATTPMVPGLAVTIPQGTKITGPDGNPVQQITITPVPIDRSPMPFPPGVTAPMLFTIQPGGAVPSQPLPITFPNVQQAPPGSSANLYFFDLAVGRWAVWGTGTVSADGRSIVSDAGFGLPRFAWHFPFSSPTGDEPGGGHHPGGGDLVDLVTGRFTVTKTDLAVPGRFPIRIQRRYRSPDARGPVKGLFGVGWTLAPYDSVLTTSGASLQLIQPDRSSYLFAPTGSGQWGNTTEPSFAGAVITQLPGDFVFQIRFKDGTVQRFDRIFGFANAAAISAITDHNGNTVTLTREQVFQLNKITQITDPAGRSLALAYDTQGRITSVTDPIGRVVGYTYDDQGRLITVTDPAGGVTRYAYGGTANAIASITDPRGITFITNEYDAGGRVIRQTQADRGVWTFDYAGNPSTQTVVTDPRGNATTYRFNSQGFMLSRTDALGETTSFEYHPGSNQLVSTTDPLGRVRRLSYDANGNVTTMTDPAGNTRTLIYEPTFNEIASITDPLGQVKSFAYDARGNLTSVTNPLGKVSTLASDSFGQLVTVTDQLGNTTSFSYDGQGNLTAKTDPLGNTWRFEYDLVGRRILQTDPLGNPTAFSYDPLNRVTSTTDALGGTTRFAYDPNGGLLTVTDAKGNAFTRTYDAMNRLATRTDPVGATESFAYDPAGNLTRMTDRKGQVSTFIFDPLNRLAGASYADGSSTSIIYDAGGRHVRVDDSSGGAFTNTYDVLDRLLAQSGSLGTVSYRYDAIGRRTSMDIPGAAITTYGYDADSRLIQIVQGTQLVAFEYDDAGRRTRLTLPNGVSTEYQYDSASRLTGLIYRNAAGVLGNLTYQYDAAGRRAQVGGSFARTLLPNPIASATYDAANRQRAFGDMQIAFDVNGNVTTITTLTGTTRFTCDARNRLVGVDAPGTRATFAYAFGRRIGKVVNDVPTHFLYDGPEIVQQLDAQGPTSYLRTPTTDEAVGLSHPEGTFFLIADALKSVVAATDPSGTVVNTYSYEPFGATSLTNPSIANPFQFTGRENEGLAGLYYYRARYYDPSIARFLSEDPIRGWYGQANFYAYVGNSPTNYVDPFGLDSSTKPPDRNNPDGDPCSQLNETCPQMCDLNFTEGSTSWWICRTEDCPRNLQLCREQNPPEPPRPGCAQVFEICPDCPRDLQLCPPPRG